MKIRSLLSASRLVCNDHRAHVEGVEAELWGRRPTKIRLRWKDDLKQSAIPTGRRVSIDRQPNCAAAAWVHFFVVFDDRGDSWRIFIRRSSQSLRSFEGRLAS